MCIARRSHHHAVLAQVECSFFTGGPEVVFVAVGGVSAAAVFLGDDSAVCEPLDDALDLLSVQSGGEVEAEVAGNYVAKPVCRLTAHRAVGVNSFRLQDGD